MRYRVIIRDRIAQPGGSVASGSGSVGQWFRSLMALLVFSALLVVGFMIALPLLAVMLVIVAVGVAWYAYRFRELRKNLREAMKEFSAQQEAVGGAQQSPFGHSASAQRDGRQGDVFEGEVVGPDRHSKGS